MLRLISSRDPDLPMPRGYDINIKSRYIPEVERELLAIRSRLGRRNLQFGCNFGQVVGSLRLPVAVHARGVVYSTP